MYSLKDKVVFVTGASNGIGAACAHAFAEHGAKVLLCARRADRLQQVVDVIKKKYNAAVHSFVLDVRKNADVERALNSLPDEWKNISVLVNNAGLARGLKNIQEGELQDWEEMIDTNVKGLLYVTRVVAPWMIARNEGHIVNIGSIAGHQVYPKGNVYCASKFAVRALNEGMRLDFFGTPVRVTSVDPGLVETEFSIVRFRGDAERAGKTYQGLTPLGAEDIADAVLYCATRPAHVNIQEMIVMPTDQASTTMVNKKV
jgi:serine 3-dehydrogenase